jgi:hypothetical protein
MQIILAIHIDSTDRYENCSVLIDYLTKLGYSIILSEVDDLPKFCMSYANYHNVKCIWSQSNGLQPHSQAINQSIPLITDENCVLWDIDCFITKEMIETGIKQLEKYDLICTGESWECLDRKCIPYIKQSIKQFSNITSLDQFIVRRRKDPNGGIRFIKSNVLKYSRGFNPVLKYWGGDDEEFYQRLVKLGFRVGRMNGKVYHVEHEVDPTSQDHQKQYSQHMYVEKVLSMNAEQTLNYYALAGSARATPLGMGEVFSDSFPMLSKEDAEVFYKKAKSLWEEC